MKNILKTVIVAAALLSLPVSAYAEDWSDKGGSYLCSPGRTVTEMVDAAAAVRVVAITHRSKGEDEVILSYVCAATKTSMSITLRNGDSVVVGAPSGAQVEIKVGQFTKTTVSLELK